MNPSIPVARPRTRTELDPRTDAFRLDLADEALTGRVEAARFAAPVPLRCAVERAAVYAAPDGLMVTELVVGEAFHAIELGEVWLWGWCGHDHYVGYARADAFTSCVSVPTHRVTARTALLFAEPSIKAPLVGRASLGARFAVTDEAGPFLAVERGFVHRRHVAPLAEHADDHVATASRLLGAPYLWGGRTGEGIDCSGLVQVALGLCGVDAPRDSDQQRVLGDEIDAARLERGDLIFFPGHVGIMASTSDLLHANAHWMTTLIEPLADVVSRLRPIHDRPIAMARRL